MNTNTLAPTDRVAVQQIEQAFVGLVDALDLLSEPGMALLAQWAQFQEARPGGGGGALQSLPLAVKNFGSFVRGIDWGEAAALVAPLTEAEIAIWVCDRIDNGDWGPEDIPMRLARYGLMDPQMFINEIRARMGGE